jgi:hypothetical protein
MPHIGDDYHKRTMIYIIVSPLRCSPFSLKHHKTVCDVWYLILDDPRQPFEMLLLMFCNRRNRQGCWHSIKT